VAYTLIPAGLANGTRFPRDPIHNRRQRPVMGALGLVALFALSACSSATVDTEPRAQTYGCVDDSKQCVDQRQANLKAMLADSKRTWVREPASAGSYAAGVRMQAFKMEKARLSCDDLTIGRREAEAAPTTLRGPTGQGLTPAQRSRGIIFADEVGRELTNEAKRRCKA
jgi:hypothetical protein